MKIILLIVSFVVVGTMSIRAMDAPAPERRCPECPCTPSNLAKDTRKIIVGYLNWSSLTPREKEAVNGTCTIQAVCGAAVVYSCVLQNPAPFFLTVPTASLCWAVRREDLPDRPYLPAINMVR